MIKSLEIHNYALISELNIEFHHGLTIISGETGAGKSIILGALALILGQRADSQVLLDLSKKCVVEGIFDIGKNQLKTFFTEHDLDYDPQTTLRREINSSGKSRAFINDTPVNLNVLKDLGMKLMDIHSQHQNILLGTNQFQLQVVDTFAGNTALLHDYSYEYNRYRTLESEYEAIKIQSEKNQSDLDYYKFQLEQLLKAKLVEGEQVELEREADILSHSEEISTALVKIQQLLSGEDINILGSTREIRVLLERIGPFYTPANELLVRFNSLEIELKDLESEIFSSGTELDHEPGRLEFIRERLNMLYALEQKHHVDSLEKLLEIQTELNEKIQSITNQDERLDQMRQKLNEKEEILSKLAQSLTESRKEIIPKLEKEIITILQELGIPNAQFAVQIAETENLTPNGKDSLDFFFSANKNIPLQELKKIASGGELSRVMLSLKSLMTKSLDMPTIIFDEIDSGVSGDIADSVGDIISGMSQTMQVVNITHLPQIASKGDKHYKVYKTEGDKATHTHIRLLNPDERIIEIAKMLSGKDLTDAAVENAKVLLSHLKN